MQSKLVTTTHSLAAVERALLDRQDSTDSTKFENPFREEGQLSKFATDIVDAVKSGKLDQIKSEESENNNEPTVKPQLNPEPEPKPEPVSQSDGVEVERGLVVSVKHSEIETILLPEDRLATKCSCCVLL